MRNLSKPGAFLDQPQVKGISFINRHTFVTQRFGDAALAQVQARLGEDAARVLRASTASEWYPLAHLVEIDRAIVEVCLAGQAERAREIGAFNLEQASKTVFRLLLRLFEPANALRKAAVLWKRLVDRGSLDAQSTGPTTARVRLDGLKVGDPIYCRVLEGSFISVLRASGAKSVEVEHPECVCHGAEACLFELRW